MNPKQTRFVQEYAVDMNATQAAIRAGYSEHTAGQYGHALLKNLEIQNALAEADGKATTKIELTAELVLTGLLDIAMHGDRDSARVRAYELLGKHLALFADRLEITQVPSSDLIEKWIEALEADLQVDV